jgi:hypothetical protein
MWFSDFRASELLFFDAAIDGEIDRYQHRGTSVRLYKISPPEWLLGKISVWADVV